jgi:hypothetical protein
MQEVAMIRLCLHIAWPSHLPFRRFGVDYFGSLSARVLAQISFFVVILAPASVVPYAGLVDPASTKA